MEVLTYRAIHLIQTHDSMDHLCSNQKYIQRAATGETYLTSTLYGGTQMQMKVLLGIQLVQVLRHLCLQVVG